jgi:hypothetical protein
MRGKALYEKILAVRALDCSVETISARMLVTCCYIERVSAKGNESRPYFSMICDLYKLEIAHARERIREIPDKRIGSTHSRQTDSLESRSSPRQ